MLELWDIDDDENCEKEGPGPQGVLLRPGDYQCVKVIKVEHDYE